MTKEERNQLIVDNEGLVYYVYNKYYCNFKMDKDDVIQELRLLMINIADKFNESLGYEFSSYYVESAKKYLLGNYKYYYKELRYINSLLYDDSEALQWAVNDSYEFDECNMTIEDIIDYIEDLRDFWRVDYISDYKRNYDKHFNLYIDYLRLKTYDAVAKKNGMSRQNAHVLINRFIERTEIEKYIRQYIKRNR